MKKYSFKNDYSEGAHYSILEKLVSTNNQQHTGYGEDFFCDEARKKIKKLLNHDSLIHFVSGGTQANLIVISSVLKPYESVIAAETGHIAVHETGAIEATGHKVNTVVTDDGKLTIKNIQTVLDIHTDEHMVKPKMVYISNTTEIGSVYTRTELQALYKFCKERDLILFLDGARLGSALVSKQEDNVTMEDLAKFTDIFYIGGTKNGALLGEAIVFNNFSLEKNFRYNLKLRGALLAKGRLIGIQFDCLFTNNLYLELAEHANGMANKLALGISNSGYSFLNKPVSNQIFPILPHALIDKLQEEFDFYIWEKINDEYAALRLVTSWATDYKEIEKFIKNLKTF